MSSSVKEFVANNPSFYSMKGPDQVLALAWVSEAVEKRQSFGANYLRSCFRAVGVEPPDLSVYLPRIMAKKPRQLLCQGDAYTLSGPMRLALDKKYGNDNAPVVVKRAIADLSARFSDAAERTFFDETIACYRVKAYRAAIVMMWNLAYSHLRDWLLADADRLAILNDKLATQKKEKIVVIKSADEFGWLKENELLEVLLTTKTIDKTTHTILKEKLGKRNLAAHPGTHEISQLQADEVIHDLATNIIFKLV